MGTNDLEKRLDKIYRESIELAQQQDEFAKTEVTQYMTPKIKALCEQYATAKVGEALEKVKVEQRNFLMSWEGDEAACNGLDEKIDEIAKQDGGKPEEAGE